MDLKQSLKTSFENALKSQPTGASDQELHRKRSRAWVGALAAEFKRQFEADTSVRVFSKGDISNREQFGLNELLYDVLVCRVSETESASLNKKLTYIHDAVWQVESELARDSHQALIDFNKLVLGSAKNKLFIGPQVTDPETFLEVLRAAGASCSGNVYAALIPHPKDWLNTPRGISVWQLVDDQWVSI